MIWTREMVEKLKKAREEAITQKHEAFTFEGQEILVGYAKYLIQFLENHFGAQKVTLGEIKAEFKRAMEDEG